MFFAVCFLWSGVKKLLVGWFPVVFWFAVWRQQQWFEVVFCLFVLFGAQSVFWLASLQWVGRFFLDVV